ncbi:MAG: hypothetical protein HZR80_00060 [Candidatus Heimdallarchaeota archaeon]
MSLEEKIEKILKIKESYCTISETSEGWLLNSIPIKREEFPLIFNKIFNENPSEKKRISILVILSKFGYSIVNLLPNITKTILVNWYAEKKFIQKYVETLDSITGNIPVYIDQLADHNHLSDLGFLFEENKQLKISLLCWQKAVEVKPDFFFGWVKLSSTYLQFSDVSKSLVSLTEGITNNEFDISSGYLKGKIDQRYRKDLQSLVASLQKKEKKNYMLVFIEGLIFHHFFEDYINARNLFVKCLRLNPTFIEPHYKIAMTFAMEHKEKKQIEVYQTIIKIDPNQIKALKNLASIYKTKKAFESAVKCYEKLAELEPNNNSWWAELAAIYSTSVWHHYRKDQPWKRDLNKAYYYYKKLLEIQPDSYNRVNDFHDLLFEMKKYKEAEELLINYLALKGHSLEMMKKLETLYTKLQQPYDQQKIIQEINYRRDKDSAYPKILELLSKVRPNIPVTLARIAKFVEFPDDKMESLLLKLIEENPGVWEYLDLEQVFIRKEDTDGLINDLRVRYSTCYYCGMPFDSVDVTSCSTCDKEILKCSVCKLPISSGEEIGKCSLCEAQGHLVHIEEWVKTQGKCSSCLQELPLHGVVPVEEELKK